MAWLPSLEFTGLVFPAGGAQFRDHLGILRGEPILQLVQRFHRQEDIRRNFDGVGFHWDTIPCLYSACKSPAIGGLARWARSRTSHPAVKAKNSLEDMSDVTYSCGMSKPLRWLAGEVKTPPMSLEVR